MTTYRPASVLLLIHEQQQQSKPKPCILPCSHSTLENSRFYLWDLVLCEVQLVQVLQRYNGLPGYLREVVPPDVEPEQVPEQLEPVTKNQKNKCVRDKQTVPTKLYLLFLKIKFIPVFK